MNNDLIHRARLCVDTYLSTIRFAAQPQVMSCLQKDLDLTTEETWEVFKSLLINNTILFNTWDYIELST